MAKWKAVLGLILSMLVTGGCGNDANADKAAGMSSPDAGPTGAGVLSVEGTSEIEADGMIVWMVGTGPSEYTYVFGQVTTVGDTFKLALDQPPPQEALNAGGVGVGFAVVSSSFDLSTIPEGRVSEETERTLQREVLLGTEAGAATMCDYAIIYKGVDATEQTWVRRFVPGFSCGKLLHDRTFEPVDCAELRLETGCQPANWT